MSEGVLYDVLRDGLWVSVAISMPILAVALAVGLAIGLLQALTSVQEMTLTFVPKLAAIGVTFWITMDMMTRALVDLWTGRLMPLAAGI
ncbi:flagellar biosynthetic protein FliQ [Hasllibacter halocynthiae]|uniref:Flagellar biosynthetic protein FliQ n=2 Tax=Hasllibacter halocynthiae TaxID=595589 RepID=A0A2T0X2N1_9RHOB|nr:flagellar biosynthetic protein FliQ [Hasllibacter halocynthiae]